MKFELDPLPYPTDALQPHIGERTLELHYGKHHRGYLAKLEKQIGGTPDADRPLEALIRTAEGSLFDNAAQVWNHGFYWKCLTPDGGGDPTGPLGAAIDTCFGSADAFRKAFADAATGEFGSGWAWLVRTTSGELKVMSSSDAGNPLRVGLVPLLTLDVWEHAYYLDYQNERARYVDAFLEYLVDWDFAAANFAACAAEDARPSTQAFAKSA